MIVFYKPVSNNSMVTHNHVCRIQRVLIKSKELSFLP